MKTILRHFRTAVLVLGLSGTVLLCAPAVYAAPQDPTAALKAKLHGSQYKDVQASVGQDGIATLSGTVQLYEYKEDAGRMAQKVKGVTGVRNQIQVAGNIPDSAIQKQLAPKIAYSREGYGNIFDALVLHVNDGVVTLSGEAHDYADRDAAVALAATTPGVKEVIDDIEVPPVSPMDWGIRMKVARSIYDYPALQKYAINPIRPIRIVVNGGHVALYGTVDSKQDKQLAYMRAQTVPGVFSVKDYIQVAGQHPESESNK